MSPKKCIVVIFRHEKFFLTLIQGVKLCTSEKRKFFDFHVNTPNPFPESGSRKRFYASGMRAIYFPHKTTPDRCFQGEIEIFSIFASIHRIHFLNQGQGNVFMLRECAQSIPPIKLPPDGCFQSEKRNFFDFRVNTHFPFPESGSR
jgi:hypothetical protein